MKTFTLHLQSGTQYERFDEVASFVAVDESGSFGVLAGHERLLSALSTGLARFRTADGTWRHVALPGAILYFSGNQLCINTRRFLWDEDYRKVSGALREELQADDERLRLLTRSLNRLEDEMLKRLWSMQREQGAIA